MRKRLFYQQSEPGSRIAATAQRLSVKARIMMALFALMLIPQGTWAQTTTYYDLWIDGTQVSSDNERDVFDDGKVSYEAANNKLILNNANLSVVYTTMSNLTIHFNGNCSIEPSRSYWNANCIMSSANDGTLTFTKNAPGDNKLTLSTRSSSYASVIRGFATLTGVPLETQEPYEIFNAGNDFSRLAQRIRQDADTIGTNYAIISADETYPLWVKNTQVTSTNKTNVFNDGMVSYDSGTKILQLVNASFDGKIRSALTGLSISVSGSNNITSPDTGTIVRSLNGGELTIVKASEDAVLTLKNNAGSAYSVIQGFSSLSYSDFTMTTSSGKSPLYGKFTDSGYSREMYGLYNSTDNKGILNVTFAQPYQLWVSDVQVTSANSAKVLGSPNVSFDATTNTLTLNSPTNLWVSGDYPGIKSGLPNLTVYVAGNTSFQFNGNATKAAFEGVNGTETITFDTNPASPAFLNVSSGQSNIIKNFQTVNYINGLSFWKKYDINSGQYDASIRTAPWTGKGIESDPFHITNFADLQQMATFLNDNRIILNYYFDMPADVNCSGAAAGFPSIGKRNSNYDIHTFSGTFDGKGNKISNLSSSYGLFAHVGDGGTVKNLTLENCMVTGGASGSAYFEPAVSAGGVVAELRGSSSKIQNCNVIGGSVSGGSNDQVCFVGGIVGDVTSGSVEGCVVNNVTISEPDASRTPRQGVGGIVGLLEGSVSGCQVMGTTTISNATSGSNDLYTGAIVGERSSATLSNNTYDAGVQVTQNADTKSNNDQRGTGQADANGNYDVFDNGAVLAGVKKLTLSVNTDGGSATVSGYYRAVGNDYYSLPTCSLTVKGTPNADYDIPELTLTNPSTNTDFSPGIPSGGNDTEIVRWSFPMPSDNLSGQMDFKIRLNKLGRVFTIDDFTYNGSGQGVTQIKTKKTSTSTNEITLSLTNGDVAFVDYMNSNGGTLAPTYNQANPPSAAGDYKISISAGNKTTGSCTVDYSINKASLADASIADIGDQTYTGSAITPEPTVTFNGMALTKGTDFKYNYSNNTNVADKNGSSAPTVTIEGLGGNFLTTPTNSKTFTIAQADFTTTTSLSIAAVTSQTYTGSEITPTPTVTFNGNPLTAGTDFEFSYANNTNAALSTATTAPTVIVTGKNNFKGTSSKTFTIDQADFSTPSVVTIAAVTGQTYTGSEITPTPTVTFGSTQLVPGTDFDYGYANNTNAALSTATPAPTVSVIGKGNFKGTSSITFTIDQADLSTSTDVVVAAIDDQVYTGTAITPQPTVTFNGNPLTAGTDFTYGYTNNVNAADKSDSPAPTVTIIGNGNFKNNKPVTFTILDRTATIAFNPGRTYMTFYDANETFLVPNNVTAYIVTSVSGNTVTTKQVSYIPAGTPVLLESTPGTTNTKNTGDSFAGNMLSFAAAAVTTDGNQYVLYSDEFVKATGTIPAGKVYLTFTSPVRRLTIDRNNSATAIEAIVEEAADGEQWYDMQGRKINKPTKDGLYIKNGKKVVVNNK